MLIKNNKGQGLIEYLILVALIAVGTVGAVRLLQESIGVQYANIINVIQGEEKTVRASAVGKSITAKRDLHNFMKGTVKRREKNADRK